MKTIKTIIGENFRVLRSKKGLSQEAIAEMTGISKSSVSRIERGEQNISADQIDSLVKALECTNEDLVNDHNKPASESGNMLGSSSEGKGSPVEILIKVDPSNKDLLEKILRAISS